MKLLFHWTCYVIFISAEQHATDRSPEEGFPFRLRESRRRDASFSHISRRCTSYLLYIRGLLRLLNYTRPPVSTNYNQQRHKSFIICRNLRFHSKKKTKQFFRSKVSIKFSHKVDKINFATFKFCLHKLVCLSEFTQCHALLRHENKWLIAK